MMKKFLALLLVAFLLVGCGGGNAGNTNVEENAANNEANVEENANNEVAEEEPVELEDRTYIVGMDDTFAPMGFRDENGELVGFDLDLATDAAERMGIDVDFQAIDWSMKETELDAGNIDFIWNGYSVTPAREEKVALSEPYLENSQIIVVLADSDIDSKEDLYDKQITVQGESSALDAMKKDTEFYEKLENEPIEYATTVECFKDVEAGRCDAIVVDEVNARYYMKQNGEENYKVLDEDFGDEVFAVGMRKDETDLVDALNNALEEQREDGTYDEIYNKWFSDN